MKLLNKDTLASLHTEKIEKPSASSLDLPEKVLQFGTGSLLRGLVDFYIDQANKNGNFNGRVVAIKSTDRGPVKAFANQDGLYTILVKGIEDGKEVERNIISSSISRILPASTQWEEILKCAENPEITTIISNTTEAGIQLVQESIHQAPPESFPAKLLAFLYRRYETFREKAAEIVIIPTELIPDNAKTLKKILLKLSHYNQLGQEFVSWLEQKIHFCSSLVDRIVPGKPDEETTQAFEQEFGYHDDLMLSTEPYNLWAIEGNEHIQSLLPFAKGNKGIIITPDINIYREIKLRLLNGTHTMTCGTAFLSGIAMVKDAMNHPKMSEFIRSLMFDEILPAIPYPVEDKISKDFATKTLDRFRNPHMKHRWISITLQYSSKIRLRVIPVLLKYYEIFDQAPKKMVTGFAAFLLFTRLAKKTNEGYIIEFNGETYPINDDNIEYFYNLWNADEVDLDETVDTILKDKSMWRADLTELDGFPEAVKSMLENMIEEGVLANLS